MKKVRIRIIDNDPVRCLKLVEQTHDFNAFEDNEAYFSSILLDGSVRNEMAAMPDVFLLHLNNMPKNREPNCDYLGHIDSLPNRPVFILYSGGGITIREQSDCYLELEQGGKTWSLTVTDPSSFCIVKHPVNSADDLSLGPAIEKYVISGDREELFRSLRNPYPVSEHLSALAILCQGYLIAHYREPGNRSPTVSEALGKMGELPGNDLVKILDRAHKNRCMTETPAWWGMVFGQFSDMPEGKKGEERRSLTNRLREEYKTNVPPKVMELVERIYDTDALNDDDLVAAVFLQIHDRLSGGVQA